MKKQRRPHAYVLPRRAIRRRNPGKAYGDFRSAVKDHIMRVLLSGAASEVVAEIRNGSRVTVMKAPDLELLSRIPRRIPHDFSVRMTLPNGIGRAPMARAVTIKPSRALSRTRVTYDDAGTPPSAVPQLW